MDYPLNEVYRRRQTGIQPGGQAQARHHLRCLTRAQVMDDAFQ
jgi:hypothetical protein